MGEREIVVAALTSAQCQPSVIDLSITRFARNLLGTFQQAVKAGQGRGVSAGQAPTGGVDRPRASEPADPVARSLAAFSKRKEADGLGH
jgi:hypothetical protein